MTGNTICSNCKGEIVEDEIGGVTTKICTNCGNTLNNIGFTSFACRDDSSYNQSNSANLEQKYSVSVDVEGERLTVLKKSILHRVKEQTQRFPKGFDYYTSTKKMFLRVISDEYYYSQEQCKMSLAVACLAMVLRKDGHAIIIDELCNDFGIDKKGISSSMAKVCETEQLSFPSVSIADIVDITLEQITSVDRRTLLREAMIKLCDLFEEVHLIGHRRIVAGACLYFAVISEKPVSLRPLTIKKFCKDYQCNCSRDALGDFLKEAKRKMLLLAKRLPWATIPISWSNCHFFIRDIIKSKSALLSRTAHSEKRHQISAEKSQGEPAGKRIKTEVDEDAISITDTMRLELPAVMIKNFGKKTPKVPEEPEHFVSKSEILGDDEIKDEEIGEYIRSPEEVKILINIQKRIEAQN